MTAEPVLDVIPNSSGGPPAAGLLASNPMPAIEASDDSGAEAGGWAVSTRRSYVALLEGLHQRELRELVRRPPGSSGLCRPLPVSPGGDGGQDNGHRAHVPSSDRRGPPPGLTPGANIAAAGEGH